MIKTNAVRALDRLWIKDELRETTWSLRICLPKQWRKDRFTARAGFQDSRRPWGPEWNLSSGNFRKPGVELQGARKPDGESEDRHASFERGASLDRVHSRRGYRSGR